MEYTVTTLRQEDLDACATLYIDTFSREPWEEQFPSRAPVEQLFQDHLANNYFAGFVAWHQHVLVALCLGIKKPWIGGMEYYIDEFCVGYPWQRQGVGSWFLAQVEQQLGAQGIHHFLLNTHRRYAALPFYEKNGFHVLEDLVLLAK